MTLDIPKKLYGDNGYSDEEFERVSADKRTKILGYMWSQNLGGLVKPPSPDGQNGAYSLVFLTNDELMLWNKDEDDNKYRFLDLTHAEQLNKDALPGGQTYTNRIINYARQYSTIKPLLSY